MIGRGNGEGSVGTRFAKRTSCSRCDVALTDENRKFGKCKPCAKSDQKTAMARYEASNPERAAALAKARDRRRYVNNPERKTHGAASSRAWAKANPEKANASHAIRESRRRARKAGNGGNVTASEWKEQLEVFGRRCAYCLTSDAKLQMEHIIPIARGGPHTIENVVPACGPCNNRKYANGPLSMLNQVGV